ncbi:hypothetical protein UFOVP1290_485 [uncultured Caudovirales phage]|uniref:Uncharacterized protein n=1 Tax=uncultured Caudovirales phage TaxID=2100421 RepID=A0A6J5RXI6_9CAUD|nr:hypothetical protein UFOVP1290_485 [uncultured Caudovirales phage]
MKKIYYVQLENNPEYSLQETIEEDFNNFSLEYLHLSFFDESNINSIYTSLEEAKDYDEHNNGGGDEEDFTSRIIVEYNLSEDDMLHFLLNNEDMDILPTNVWYQWWDEKQKKLKEIPKAFI